MRALLDTSVFVAAEPGRPLGGLGQLTETEVSVVTLAELTAGVLTADDVDRPTRLATLTGFEARWDPLPVDGEVARRFARLVAELRAQRRRIPVLDLLIAATALVEEIPVVTQDRDYDAVSGLEVIAV